MSILNSILNEVWAIEPNFAASYTPFINSLIEGKDPSKLLPQKQECVVNEYPMSMGGGSHGSQSGVNSAKKIAVFTIKGALTKDDGFCSAGMETMNRRLTQLLANPDISGIILDMDTPGGEASYTPIFAKTIKEAKKPIITYTNRLLASAGYWLASASREIYASNEHDTISSIGTMVTMIDFREKMKNEGVNLVHIYASKSSEKNFLHKAFLNEDYDTIKTEMLDPVNESFLNHVKSQREIKDESVYNGKTYYAKEALTKGLIDGIKSFDECLLRMEELISSDSIETNPQINNKMNKNIQTVASLLGYESLESKDGHITLSNEDMSTIGEALAASADEDPEPNNESEKVAKLESKLKSYEKENSELTEKMEAQEERLEKLEAKLPAGKPSGTQVPESTETDNGDVEALDPWNDASNPLNQKIDSDLQ